MATLGVKYFEAVSMSEYEAGLVFEYPEEASQTFKYKAPVVFDGSSGEIEIAVDTGFLYGLSLLAATGTTGTSIPVQVLTPNSVWAGTLSTAGATVITALTDVGQQYSWILSTVTGETAKTVVDQADTTTPHCLIIALDPRDAVGDNNGRVLFMWERTALDTKTS